MLVSDFDFDLPAGLIAAFPLKERDSSRLMVLNRKSAVISESVFRDIPSLLQPGDLLVMNDTRVIPARLYGTKETGGSVEVFLLRRHHGCDERWECMIRGAKRTKTGQCISFSGGMIATVIRNGAGDSPVLIEFTGDEPFLSWLDREGHVPLPPYIRRSDTEADKERYQTVFAAHPGAVAAPTAGLHITSALLEQLEAGGVLTASLTLHTGLGTFQPVRVEEVEEHRIHLEWYLIPEETARLIAETRAAGRRVVALGTTTARALENSARNSGSVVPGDGEAEIFIYPGYRFKVVDVLVTNFHLPRSTLLMLVSAFAGKDFLLSAYSEAVRRGFRFYSYGDAMMIL